MRKLLGMMLVLMLLLGMTALVGPGCLVYAAMMGGSYDVLF